MRSLMETAYKSEILQKDQQTEPILKLSEKGGMIDTVESNRLVIA